METIEIELEDGTVLEVSKDFLDATPEDQEAFLREVTGTPSTPAAQQENTTSDILTGLGSSSLRLLSNVADFGEFTGDLLTYDNPLEVDLLNAIGLDDEGRQEMRAREQANFEAKRDHQGLLARMARGLDDSADKMGRYQGETTGGDVIDAFRGGRPLEGLAAAGRVGAGGAITSAPEALPYLNPLTAVAQGLQNVGDTAEARAVNDGREQAELSDLMVAAPAEAANTALSRIGLRVPVGQGVTGTLGRTAVEGLTGTAQGAISDTAQTLGTETGFDLERTAERALEEGLTGTAGGAAFQGAAETGRTLSRRADEQRMGEMTPERARVMQIEERATQDIQSHLGFLQEQGQNVSLEVHGTQSARTLARQATNEYLQAVRDLKKVGKVKRGPLTDDDGFQASLETHFDQLMDAGRNAKNMQALPLEDHISAIDALSVPDSVKASLRDQVTYIQALSDAGVKIRQRSGPIGSTLRTFGGIIGHAGGFEAGANQGKTPAFAGATAGSTVLGNLGGAVGSRLDAMLGQSAPDITRDQAIRQRMLAREGLDAAELDLASSVGPYSREAAEQRRIDRVQNIIDMKTDRDSTGRVGSPRLKEIQQHQDITAGETLEAIKTLTRSGELDKATARDLLYSQARMDDDDFYKVQDLIGVEARLAREGRTRPTSRFAQKRTQRREEGAE
ncbi:MAG: hypothetical protein AAF608_05050 [Pseudomonadota bacterium]